MDQLRLGVGPPEDTNSVPEELRCKRSDGKQWRCSALSMPDKTVCEKHYIQAKKRAANSALRASLKKARRMAQEDEEEVGTQVNGFGHAVLGLGLMAPGKRFEEKSNGSNYVANGVLYRANKETGPKLVFGRNGVGITSDMTNGEGRESGGNGIGPVPVLEENSLNCSTLERPIELICHQCRLNARVLLCTSCNKNGYCANCISKWYPEIPLDEIKKVCPACRGICNCHICLQGDNLIKAKVQEMGGIEKLKYLHGLLVYVRPVVRQIYSDQCFEIGVEAKVQGSKVVIPRAKINPDQQMLCDFCKVPIFDYHRHCPDCSYDLCLACCRDIRDASKHVHDSTEARPNSIHFSELFPSWKASRSGIIPCGSYTSGGCGGSELILRRILKINWISKLAKNTEEMVNGCRVHREMDVSCGIGEWESSLYCPLWDDVKQEGVGRFFKYWERGSPVVIRHAFEMLLASSWDPLSIWRGIKDTFDEDIDERLTVRAMDCKSQTEVFMLMHTTGLHHGKGTSILNNDEMEENQIANGSKFDSEFSIELERENLVGAVWDVFQRKDVQKLNEFLRARWQEIGSARQPHAE